MKHALMGRALRSAILEEAERLRDCDVGDPGACAEDVLQLYAVRDALDGAETREDQWGRANVPLTPDVLAVLREVERTGCHYDRTKAREALG
ncbi:hypothetical protein [Alienimonas chondri]|uniref:Uncharacterized protein n=1 Tax=Alienimonas chondri TaxID=2681879 RepID=A0ABX1VEF4_9PLAN|nr:hypothetical protein [Alienimonas chondri]NNJ26470.1 hypothetical protein [Alienimonas chondri]